MSGMSQYKYTLKQNMAEPRQTGCLMQLTQYGAVDSNWPKLHLKPHRSCPQGRISSTILLNWNIRWQR